MASSPPTLYGLDRELAQKAAGKFDIELERQTKQWIANILPLVPMSPETSIQALLRDGIVLCQLVNAIFPEMMVKYSTSSIAFHQMENINKFLKAAEKIGCPQYELFQTVDLYEAKNIPQVVGSIFSFSRNCMKKGYKGPLLGPKLSDEHHVEFTTDQLSLAKAMPSKQMGFSQGANQSGISYGTRREIVDTKTGTGIRGEVSQQMGSNKGANQSGIAFGAKREISSSQSTTPVATPLEDAAMLASPLEKIAPSGGVC